MVQPLRPARRLLRCARFSGTARCAAVSLSPAPVVQKSRIPLFQGGDTGSNPVGSTAARMAIKGLDSR